MAEARTGKPWNQIFADELAAPLNLPAAVTYYTAVQQGTGTVNPRVAGGLQASMNEYAPLLALSFHRGTYKGTVYAPASLFDAQAVEPYPGVTIGVSPVANLGLPYRYGLAAWLECPTPATGCSILSSPGAFGWTPWVDRQAGYYAMIGMNYNDGASSGVVQISVTLAQQLQPEIRKALGR
jgi:CubicO group peptidase (beta-lactamase class C family)